MPLSAEVRWFWRRHPPRGLESWFRAAGDCPVGGGLRRVDRYLRDASQSQVGIKRRGGKRGIEVKSLVQVLPELAWQGLVAPVEIWSKWTVHGFAPRSLVRTVKHRWLRLFDCTGAVVEVALGSDEKPRDGQAAPARGCKVELTRVELDEGPDWWTFALEAFGERSTLEEDLARGAAEMAGRGPPVMPRGIVASYPAWLARRVAK